MSDTQPFGLLVLITAAALLCAVLANRFSARIPVPLPAVFLAVAAVLSSVFSDVHPPDHRTVQRVVTLALLMILFDGGLHIGWNRFRQAGVQITVVGIVGTFGTTAAAAAIGHWAFGLSWYLAVLLAAAVAPTDPAVVFSVLGQRQIAGRSSTILEGESGANDPVGIAFTASLIAAGGLNGAAVLHVSLDFASQLVIGAIFGIAGARLLLWCLRRTSLPSEGLYPLLSLSWILMLFGLTTIAHGSGFLAVFVAGISLGDARAPYKREIERFHSALASLGEIVAFALLGLTVDLNTLGHANVLVPGLVIGAALALIIRPVVVGCCLAGAGLSRNERQFVLFAGLKGAVPILLGGYLLQARIAQADRIYGIVVVVVLFSVIVQGSLVPLVARRLSLSITETEPQPWALGVRLRDEPGGVNRLRIEPGSPLEGCTVETLTALGSDVWVSFVVRDLQLVPVRPETRLLAGDEVLVVADPARGDALSAAFKAPPQAPPNPPQTPPEIEIEEETR